MKSLKLEDVDLHRRLKKACVDNDLSMLDAVHQMVKEWVAAVEARRPGLDLKSPAIEKADARQSDEKPSLHLEHDAKEQQVHPTYERLPANSTKHEKDATSQKDRRPRKA